MMAARACSRSFSPLESPLQGSVSVPGDKSLSHRAVLFAAMAEGSSSLEGVLASDDVFSSIGAVRALGADVELRRGPTGALSGTVAGWGQRGPVAPHEAIDCGNSGTTTRLLMGLLARVKGTVTLEGDASLTRRPMMRVIGPLRDMGVDISATPAGTLPVTVAGSARLHACEHRLSVASAQVKSALLLAGLQTTGTTTIDEPVRSRDHTELMLPAFGVAVQVDGSAVSVTGPCHLKSANLKVPGDPSSAAFLLCAAAMRQGSEVTVTGITLNPTRLGFLKVMRRMGAHVITRRTGVQGLEPVGDVTVIGDVGLFATRIPADEIPSLIDEIPVLALLSTFAEGTTCFEQVGELRVKESDRLAAILEGFSALGCTARVTGDDLYVEGGRPCRDAELSTAGDHRFAMCWALAGLCGGVTTSVDDFDCVSVSYPTFLEDILKMGPSDTYRQELS